MTRRMSEQQKASRKRAKWLAEFRGMLTDDELNVEALKGMGLSDSDIEAILGESVIIDAEVVEVEDPSTDQAVNRADEPAIHLPAVIVKPNPSEQQQDSIKYSQWSEEWWQHAKPEVQARRCKAHKKDGSQCLKAAINGATVCRYHGGAARHVKQAARARIENAADLMAKQLLRMAIDENVADAVKLSAIKDALDRGGLKAPETVVLSPGQQTGFDEIFDDIYSGPRTTGDPVSTNVSLGIDYRDIQGPVAQQQDQNHPTQHRDTADHSTRHAAGTPVDPYDPLSDRPAHTDPMVRPSSRGGRHNDLDEHSAPREYGRPARPGAQVSGYEAMRIAREAQELSRRLAGLESGLDD